MQSPIMPCCIQVRRNLRLSLSRSRAGCTGQVLNMAKARDKPTDDKKLYRRIGRPLRVDAERLRHSVVQGVMAVRRGRKTRWRASAPRSYFHSAGIDYSPQEFSPLAMGCCYNGMEISVVFVFWGTGLAQIIGPGAARSPRFHSSTMKDERLELMRPVFQPAALGCNFPHMTCRLI